MKISEYEFSKINNWIRINRDVIKNIYSLFLNICNDKYDLKIMNSKQLFFDLSLYLYYNTEDKYGITLFDSNEAKKNYICSLNNEFINDRNIDENNNYDTLKNNKVIDYEQKINKYDENIIYRINNQNSDDSSTFSDFSHNDYDNFDDCYTDEHWDELYNKFFNNDDDPTLYHFIPSSKD